MAQLPLLLFVDSEVAQFPFEVCPCLRSLEVVRGVAPNVTLTAFQRHQRSSQDMDVGSALARAGPTVAPEAALPNTLIRNRSRTSYQTTVGSCLPAGGSAALFEQSGTGCRARPRGGFYVLDPLEDASCSQAQLQTLLGKWPTWAGHVGRHFLEGSELISRLASEDAFLYMGHGGKCMKKLLKPEALQMGASVCAAGEQKSATSSSNTSSSRVPLHSIVMLMGCSTAKISRHQWLRSTVSPTCTSLRARCVKTRSGSMFEAYGAPLDVLIGGAPAVVGALWDVLGGDLEQLVCSMLEAWVQGPRAQKHVARDSTRLAPVSLMRALVEARKACRLRFLTGAAIVCYGIPM